MSLPTSNPFLRVTPEIRKSAERNLHEALARRVSTMCYPGQGERRYVLYELEQVQQHLNALQEYGFTEVRLIDETKLEDLAVAIGVYRRGNLSNEIRALMTNLLTGCGIPASVFEEKK